MASKIRTFKKILHAGHGPVPEYNTDTKALFHYEVLMPRNDVEKEGFPEDKDLYQSIDSTKKPWPDGYGKPLELVFGKKFQLAVLETCVSTMLVDEISQFDIDKSELYAYPMTSKRLRDISHCDVDKKYDPDRDENNHHCAAHGPIRTGYPILDELIEKPRPLRFIIHLLKVMQPNEYSVDNWQMNSEQKLKSLERYRLEGNEFFAQKNYDAASTKYREALGVIDNLLLQEKPGDEEWIELDKKNVPFYLNLSQCYLSLARYRDAAECANEVLKRDSHNEKALFRHAKAMIGQWELNRAKEDLNHLLEHHPNVAALVHEQLAVVAQKQKEKSESDRINYKTMIDGLLKKK